LLGLIGALLFALVTPATAGFMGNTVGIFDRVDAPFSFPPGVADTLIASTVVGSQTEYDAFFDFIDIADTTITIGNNDRNCSGGSCPISFLGQGDFYGFKIADTSDEIAPILSVSVLSSTDPSFTNADITFSDDEIFISIEDFNNYNYGSVIPFGEVVLQVTFAEQSAQISAPGGTFGLIAGAFAIAAIRRRRSRTLSRPRPRTP
tara:strand:+ start:524 stop:1138 length:615 start_codon:yes stop_codon:yes gene_type:complete